MYNTGEFRFLKVKSENIFEEYFLSFLKVNILQNEMLPQNLFFFSHTKKRLSIVACGMLDHSSSMAVRSLLHIGRIVRPVGCTAKFSETPLKTVYGREMNIQFSGNSSGGHSCSQHEWMCACLGCKQDNIAK